MNSRLLTTAFLASALLAPLAHADGETCVSNAGCGQDEFCRFVEGTCLRANRVGACLHVAPDSVCSLDYSPVCGCNFVTYSNECWAILARVSLLYRGPCRQCGAGGEACGPDLYCDYAPGQCGPDLPGVCLPPLPSHPLTFAFEGTVDSLFDGLGPLADVVPGDRFHGTLTFDRSTPNTGEVGEGIFGVFHHETGRARVRLVVGDLTVTSVPGEPDLTLLVRDEVGIAGADEFGFEAGNTVVADAGFSPETLAIRLDWLLSELVGNPILEVELPECPIDPAAFENNQLSLDVDCVPCAGPASFIEVRGPIDVFESDVTVLFNAGRSLRWNRTEIAESFDVLTGDLANVEDFASMDVTCLANNVPSGPIVNIPDPPSGEGRWFLVRAERSQGTGSWDSSGLRQIRPRDPVLDESRFSCPGGS